MSSPNWATKLWQSILQAIRGIADEKQNCISLTAKLGRDEQLSLNVNRAEKQDDDNDCRDPPP